MKIFKSIPRTVEEAIKQVLSGWSMEEKESFRNLPVNDLFDLRNTLGADIRNVFSLWHGNDELLNDCEKYLERNMEFYTLAVRKKEEIEQGKKKIDTYDFLMDAEDDMIDDEDLNSPLFEDSVIDPYIASQVIIFASWKYLQANYPIL